MKTSALITLQKYFNFVIYIRPSMTVIYALMWKYSQGDTSICFYQFNILNFRTSGRMIKFHLFVKLCNQNGRKYNRSEILDSKFTACIHFTPWSMFKIHIVKQCSKKFAVIFGLYREHIIEVWIKNVSFFSILKINLFALNFLFYEAGHFSDN